MRAKSNARAAKAARPSGGRADKAMCRAGISSYAYGHQWTCPSPKKAVRSSSEDFAREMGYR